MEKNCLKTQLKATVNNDNLLYLNAFVFSAHKSNGYVKNNHGIKLSIASNTNTTIVSGTEHGFYVNSDTTLYHSYPLITSSAREFTIYAENADYNIQILDRDCITGILGISGNTANYLGFDISQCKYPQAFENINISNNPYVTGTLNSISSNRVWSIILNTLPININLNTFTAGKLNRKLELKNMASVVGSIDSDSFVATVKTSVQTTFDLTLNNVYVEGDLDVFAQKLVTAGKTSGVINFNGANTSITMPTTAKTNWTITFDSSLPNGYSIA